MSETTAFTFQNTELAPDERAADLVSRLTLEEKIQSMVQYQPAIERLGIKAYKHGTEAAHGMAWLGEATVYPQPIGLGCTWNPELMKEVGSAIGDEARVFYQRNSAVNGLTLWAPTVDMERDPRWGRTEEAYGEDPRLTGELTAALVQGIQGDHPRYFKAIATLKHFIGNNNEINRGSCSASIDPRNMKEYYQAAFKPAFVQGGAKSMMTSYNAVNGVPTILLDDVKAVVKEEWGMDGFIVSDAGDLLGIVNDHHYYDTYKEAVAHAIKAGIDSITDEKETTCRAIEEALEEGLLQESDLDTALRNTFRVRFMLGEFDPAEMNPYSDIPDAKVGAPEHAALSKQAALESFVLLKNEDGLLPLAAGEPSATGESQDTASPANKGVAVIGPLADVVYRDWYSGSLPYAVTPLDGIKSRLAGGGFIHAIGDDIVAFHTVDGKPLLLETGDSKRLIVGEDGAEPEHFRVTNWGWGSLTLRSLSTGKLLSSADDAFLAAVSDEAYGWFVKEVLHYDEAKREFAAWNGDAVIAPANGGAVAVAKKEKETDQANAVEHGVHAAAIQKTVVHDGLAEAVEAARTAETAVVVVGNNPLINGKEEIDRPGLELPVSQQALINAVLDVNPRTVVVIIGSYPFVLGELAERIPAILYSSHGGQELGSALASVLFGDYSPAGRLNMTWYASEEQLGDLLDYDIMKSKLTYLYHEGKALYHFGHGLSYGEFRYGELALTNGIALNADAAVTDEDNAALPKGGVTARLTVTNLSDIPAEEVVQLYVTVEGSRVQRPLKKLTAFKRVLIQPGQSVEVELTAPVDDLAIWDVTRSKFCLEKARYTFMAAASSEDVRSAASLDIEGEVIPSRDLSLPTSGDAYDDYEGVYLDENKEGGFCVAVTGGGEGWIAYRDIKRSLLSVDSFWKGRIHAAGKGSITLGGSPNSAEYGSIALNGNDPGWTDIEIPLQHPADVGNDFYIRLSGDVRLSLFEIINGTK
ncbi:glycoside hydrolase family 3 C-terminal domain-containing protein [Paenibacillus sp. CAU 1782]